MEIDKMNDFDYVDNFFCSIAEKEDTFGHNVLTHNEKIILAVWHATGLIQNGGLQYFFVWEDANPIVADYFYESGLYNASQIIREFFLLFSELEFEKYPSAKRDEIIENKIIKYKDEIELLNERFYEAMPEVESKLADFIRNTQGVLK